MQLQMQMVEHGKPSNEMVYIGPPNEVTMRLAAMGAAPLNGMILAQQKANELAVQFVNTGQLPDDEETHIEYSVDWTNRDREVFVDPEAFIQFGGQCVVHAHIVVTKVIDVDDLPPLRLVGDDDAE